jgi:hypothetical protein
VRQLLLDLFAISAVAVLHLADLIAFCAAIARRACRFALCATILGALR